MQWPWLCLMEHSLPQIIPATQARAWIQLKLWPPFSQRRYAMIVIIVRACTFDGQCSTQAIDLDQASNTLISSPSPSARASKESAAGAAGSWRALAPLRGGGRNHLGVTSHGGLLYVFGGQLLEREHGTSLTAHAPPLPPLFSSRVAHANRLSSIVFGSISLNVNAN